MFLSLAMAVCSNLYAQVCTSDLLIEAKNSFESKDYDSVFAASSAFYRQYTAKDSLFYEMKRYEYLAYNRIGKNDISKQIIKDVINGDIDQVYTQYTNVVRHYRNYLNIASPNEDIEVYEKSIRGILHPRSRGYYSYEDYQFYLKMLQYKYGSLPYDKKLEMFDRENSNVDDYNKKYFDAYYNFVKGRMIIDGEWNGASRSPNINYSRDKVQIIKACSFLRMADELFYDERDRDKQIIKYHDEVLETLVKTYKEVGHYEAAAFYCRKRLQLLYQNWKEWGRRNPWESGEWNFVMHPFTAYEEYIELLFDSQQYAEVVKYSNEVLSDPLFPKSEETNYDYVQYHIDRAKAALYKHKGPDLWYMNRLGQFYEKSRLENLYVDFKGRDIPIDEIIEKYTKGELHITKEIIRNGSSFPYLDFFRFLIDRGDYNQLISITDHILNIFYSDEGTQVSPLQYYLADTYPNPITKYDYQIAAGRDLWHHANGISFIWLSYKYRALAYKFLGNYEETILNQKICVDNVRTDWEFEPNEREGLLGVTWQSFKWNLYTDIEKEELYSLAEYYRMNGEYENAAIYYRKLLALNRDILSKLLDSSSWDEKVRQWEKNNTVYKQIIRNKEIVNNPYFSDIVFECSSVLKSFLLNVKLNEHAAIDIDDSYRTRKLWEKKIRVDRMAERECYLENNIRDSFLDGIEVSAELESIINAESVLPLDDIYAQVKSLLRPNEVIVDFFITKENQGEYMMEYDDQWRSYVIQDISACICRSDWDKPKIVSLDNLGDFPFTYFLPQYSQDANNDMEFGKAVWDKIITISEITDGDIIYFSPTGNLNQISLENLLINDGEYMSDKYDIYRLTSYRQLASPSDKISKDDKWALFASGNRYFGERVNTKCNTKFQNLNTLDLNDLEQLPGTARTMDYIYRKEIYSTLRKYNRDFNEVEFFQLSMQSPSLIYIGSHGYYMNDSMNITDSLYLFGCNRSVALSKEEASMYKSGIVMNRVPSHYTTMSDGLLTAKEISLLDLSSTKLVSVSACSTGLGTVTVEGVYGLQRGFKLAGVQSLLVSLWDVDDKATEILMTSFYDNLRSGFSKQKSLKNAQKAVRTYVERGGNSVNLGDIYLYDNPYYWAGFVLVDGNE